MASESTTPPLPARYTRLRVIGGGAYGEVSAGVDAATGARVALKTILRPSGVPLGDAAARARTSARGAAPQPAPRCACTADRELAALVALRECAAGVVSLLGWSCACGSGGSVIDCGSGGAPHGSPSVAAVTDDGGGSDGDGDTLDRWFRASSPSPAPAALPPPLCLALQWWPASLAALLGAVQAAGARLPHPLQRSLCRQLLAGLAAVHAAGWCHRDVKPGNLLLRPAPQCIGEDGGGKDDDDDDDGDGVVARLLLEGGGSGGGSGVELVLADFGLARRMPAAVRCKDDGADCDRTAAGGIAGGQPLTGAVQSRWYRAPEVLYGAHAYDPAAIDAWGAGVVCAEILRHGAPLAPGCSDVEQLSRLHRLLGSPEVEVSAAEGSAAGGAATAPTPHSHDGSDECWLPGAPNAWHGIAALPDYGKVLFDACAPAPLVGGGDGAALPPGTPAAAADLVARLLRWDPDARLTPAAAVAGHPWLRDD